MTRGPPDLLSRALLRVGGVTACAGFAAQLAGRCRTHALGVPGVVIGRIGFESVPGHASARARADRRVRVDPPLKLVWARLRG